MSNFADNFVNLYGIVWLVNAVLPGMRAAGGGRIFVTSSTVGLVAPPMLPVYCTTKFAVEGYIESMAATYAPVGIHFSLVEPGPVGTPFGANAHAAAVEAPAELAGVARLAKIRAISCRPRKTRPSAPSTTCGPSPTPSRSSCT